MSRNCYYTCLPLYHQNLIRFEGKIGEYVEYAHYNFDARGHWPFKQWDYIDFGRKIVKG